MINKITRRAPSRFAIQFGVVYSDNLQLNKGKDIHDFAHDEELRQFYRDNPQDVSKALIQSCFLTGASSNFPMLYHGLKKAQLDDMLPHLVEQISELSLKDIVENARSTEMLEDLVRVADVKESMLLNCLKNACKRGDVEMEKHLAFHPAVSADNHYTRAKATERFGEEYVDNLNVTFGMEKTKKTVKPTLDQYILACKLNNFDVAEKFVSSRNSKYTNSISGFNEAVINNNLDIVKLHYSAFSKPEAHEAFDEVCRNALFYHFLSFHRIDQEPLSNEMIEFMFSDSEVHNALKLEFSTLYDFQSYKTGHVTIDDWFNSYDAKFMHDLISNMPQERISELYEKHGEFLFEKFTLEANLPLHENAHQNQQNEEIELIM